MAGRHDLRDRHPVHAGIGSVPHLPTNGIGTRVRGHQRYHAASDAPCAIVGGAVADIFDRRVVARVAAAVGATTSLLQVLNVTVFGTQLWAVYALHAIGTSLLMGGARQCARHCRSSSIENA